MRIQDFCFDVHERPVTLPTGMEVPGYKAIVRRTQDGSTEPISIVKNSYKLIPNRMLIGRFLDHVQQLRVNWHIDASHSFVLPNRMRMQITFPEIHVHDGISRIPLSVYLHNSYDQSEGVRIYWGAIRSVCTNGMILGSVLGKLYARHTKGFDSSRFEEHFHNIRDHIHTVESRIKELHSRAVDETLMKQLQKVLGKKRLAEITQTDSPVDVSQWDMYNDVTWLISHKVDKPMRADLQLKTAAVFDL